MRVYDIYSFPVGTKLTLKEQFAKVRLFLADRGWRYEHLLFQLPPVVPPVRMPKDILDLEVFQKYVESGRYSFDPYFKKFPELRDYAPEGEIDSHSVLTNMDERGLPLKPAPDCMDALAEKIPRPLNPDDGLFAFCGIPFFGESTPHIPGKIIDPARTSPNCACILIDHDNVFPNSRGIRLKVDVTNTADSIRSSLPIATALAEYLPKKWNSHLREVVLDDEDEIRYAALRDGVQPLIENIEKLGETFLEDIPPATLGSSGYSLSKPLKKALAKVGFTSTGYASGLHYFRKIDRNGHGVCLWIDSTPLARIIYPHVQLRGLGFEFEWELRAFIPANQQEADEWCSRFAAFLSGEFSDALETLSSRFPKTPHWFFTATDR